MRVEGCDEGGGFSQVDPLPPVQPRQIWWVGGGTRLGLGTNFAGATIKFRETVSMSHISNFGETFAKFAQNSLKKKDRGVSEGPGPGPGREKNQENHQETALVHEVSSEKRLSTKCLPSSRYLSIHSA